MIGPNGGSTISQEGAPTSKVGPQTYYFGHFFQKINKIEKRIKGRVCPYRPLDPPPVPASEDSGFKKTWKNMK